MNRIESRGLEDNVFELTCLQEIMQKQEIIVHEVESLKAQNSDLRTELNRQHDDRSEEVQGLKGNAALKDELKEVVQALQTIQSSLERQSNQAFQQHTCHTRMLEDNQSQLRGIMSEVNDISASFRAKSIFGQAPSSDSAGGSRDMRRGRRGRGRGRV